MERSGNQEIKTHCARNSFILEYQHTFIAVGFYCGNSVAEKGIVGYFNARAKAKETDSEEDNNIGENG